MNIQYRPLQTNGRTIIVRNESIKSDIVDTTIPKVSKIPEFCNKNRHFRYASNRKRNERVVFKSGEFNIEKPYTPFIRWVNIVSCFTESRWRWTLIYCYLVYIISWVTFACIWWIVLYTHGDLNKDHLPHTRNSTEWIPCVREIYGFTSMFLFSIEIHTTLGYGTRSLTMECPVAMFVMCIQGIFGTIMQSFLIAMVFAKLTRPKNRTQTLLFTKNAVINHRDNNMCMIFRVGNVRKSRIIGVSVHAFLIRLITKRGELLKSEQVKLDLLVDTCQDIIFTWPVSVVHKIDENSPFYCISAAEMLTSKMEIVVVLEGTIESTGQPVQAKSSYTSREILWGHRFVQMVNYRHDRNGYEVDYSKFDETLEVTTPLCSALMLPMYLRMNGI